MKVNFAPGKIVNRLRAGDKTIIFRYPRIGDAKALMEYINAMVEEGTRIGITERQTLAEERKWLNGMISDIRKGMNYLLIAECDSKVIGTGRITRNRKDSFNSHTASLGFGVLKECRRLGIGSKLASSLIGHARSGWKTEIVTSSYANDNTASARLHYKLGFKIIGRIPRGAKYKDGYMDEILVVKEL